MKNLNIGQQIGVGPVKVNLPGLNTEIPKTATGNEEIKALGANEDYFRGLEETRTRFLRHKKPAIPVDERGWTGGHIGGRSIGALQTIEGLDASSFDTRVLYYAHRMIMTSKHGKRRIIRAVVAVGNGKGIFGLGADVGSGPQAVLHKAKVRAARNLVFINIDQFDSTVLHNFVSEFGHAQLYVTRRGQGHGLECHRLIQTMCRLIGIKNLYAKSDRSRNNISIANAFLLGLIRQKSYQQWADETNLMVVALDERANNKLEVLASPSSGYVRPTIAENEDFDMDRLSLGGLTRWKCPALSARRMWYMDTPQYQINYLANKVMRLRAFRSSVVDAVSAFKDIDERNWRYPMFNPNCEHEDV